MSFFDKSSKDWFTEAMVFCLIAKVYDSQGLVGNAGHFEQRAIYSLAQAILARWFEVDERFK